MYGDFFEVPNGVTSLEAGILSAYYEVKRVKIPASIISFHGEFFPNTIEQIEIDSNNPTFLSINGQICSKDKKKLYMCYSKSETVTLEEGIETIGESAFISCNSSIINFPTTLQSLPFNSLNGMKNVKNIKLGKNVNNISDSMCVWNVNLEHIEIDAENPYYMSENDAIYTKNKKILVAFVNNVVSKFEIPSGVEEIGSSAFEGRNRLSELIIPNTVIEIKNNCVSRTVDLK